MILDRSLRFYGGLLLMGAYAACGGIAEGTSANEDETIDGGGAASAASVTAGTVGPSAMTGASSAVAPTVSTTAMFGAAVSSVGAGGGAALTDSGFSTTTGSMGPSGFAGEAGAPSSVDVCTVYCDVVLAGEAEHDCEPTPPEQCFEDCEAAAVDADDSGCEAEFVSVIACVVNAPPYVLGCYTDTTVLAEVCVEEFYLYTLCILDNN